MPILCNYSHKKYKKEGERNKMVLFSKSEKTHSNKYYRKLYNVWNHMMNRCYNENDDSYPVYVGNVVISKS